VASVCSGESAVAARERRTQGVAPVSSRSNGETASEPNDKAGPGEASGRKGKTWGSLERDGAGWGLRGKDISITGGWQRGERVDGDDAGGACNRNAGTSENGAGMQQAKEGTKQMIDLPEDEQLHAAIEMSLIEAAAETRKDTVKTSLQERSKELCDISAKDSTDVREVQNGQKIAGAATAAETDAAADACQAAGDSDSEEMEDVDVMVAHVDSTARQGGAAYGKTAAAAGSAAPRQGNGLSEDEMDVADVADEVMQGHNSDSDIEITYTSHSKNGKTAAELEEKEEECDPCCVCGSADEDGMLLLPFPAPSSVFVHICVYAHCDHGVAALFGGYWLGVVRFVCWLLMQIAAHACATAVLCQAF
jgi:hypothetical protein